jgi:ATP-dependent Lhr-like helicase
MRTEHLVASQAMALSSFHPAVEAWFQRELGEPTAPQREAWPAIARGEHALIAAPTGSGKTLAAFLAAIDALVREGTRTGELPDESRVVYVSPLRALSHDIEKNLQLPLAGVARELEARGEPVPRIRTWVRTGDTPARARAVAAKSPPHIVVTTPESLYLLLTSDSGRRMLGTVRTVIVDEIHALVRDKRGSHLALSLERLDALVQKQRGARLQRIGLSATQKPIEVVARFLVGGGAPELGCHIVDAGHRRTLDLALGLPGAPLDAVMSHEVWSEVYEQLVALVEAHKTTLVFVNTRRAVERVAKQLSDRLGEAHVGAHHGSLSKEKRLDAETRLKSGQLRVLVATSSLELGIDIGDVDLVCQLGSPRSIAGLLQRVGRSGHQLRGTPKGRLFPLSRDDLVECAALCDAVRRGELDRVRIPLAPLDVLAQQIVAAAAVEDLDLGELFALVRRTVPYGELARADFDAVIAMLAEGFSTRRGRRAALLHHDAVQNRVKARRGARLVALTSGGAIPDTFDYQVVLEPENLPVGTVHEDFAIESMAGDVFQLGNASYRIRKTEPGTVRVEDARGQPPTLPFWIADAPGRSDELSDAVSRLRTRVDGWLDEGLDRAVSALEGELALEAAAARQVGEYLAAARGMLGTLPTKDTLVLERFFDETGSMHMVLHAPFGTRLNRALGLSLRKRFCRSFNVELQAAASDDAVVLSLGPMHSFELSDVFGFLRRQSVRDVLVQALLPAPMFNVHFRWNASRALAVPRARGGKKVPPRIQRMLADDLLAVCFPDQVACAENLEGELEVPDHPLVQQTVSDCLHTVMDVAGLEVLLGRIEAGELTCLARDLTEPSPLAHEILNARPYAFLDDAPLEERRTQAVQTRRWLDPATAQSLGGLDAAAIERVVAECQPDCRDEDELHDVLLVHASLPAAEGDKHALAALFEKLCATRRATVLELGGAKLWVAAERVGLWKLAVPEARFHPELVQPAQVKLEARNRDEALREIVRGRLEATGPTTVGELSDALGLAPGDVEAALGALEAEGFVMRGRYRPAATDTEWCERRLLSRIHRATLDRLRAEIEPVSPAVFMRFLLEHQHVSSAARLRGQAGLMRVIEQLAGFELGAAAWEREVLPVRVADYAPELLDTLAWTGQVAWARAVPEGAERREGPVRATPVALFPRLSLDGLRGASGADVPLSISAERIRAHLAERGASFVDDLSRGTGFERPLVEEALSELVAQGLVTSDGFMGLRALVGESSGALRSTVAHAGRYALLPPSTGIDVELLARTLLKRWGVVFRKLVERETAGVRWLDILRVLRGMEARGDIRGGRFVSGFAGEQFATREAVSALRRVRREEARDELVSLCGSDPLNLVGLILPGPRVPAVASSRILLRDGGVAATLVAGEVRFTDEGSAELEAALRGKPARRRPAIAQIAAR